MSISKKDLYKLINRLNEKETDLAYNILKSILRDKGKSIYELIEADNTPLDEEEKRALNEAVKEDTVDWEELKRELNL